MSFWSKSKSGDPQKQSSGLLIIRHQFAENELIYRYPIENLTSGSQVLVQQGQEAILCVDGAVKRVYSRANTYEIQTNDIYMPGGINNTMTERVSQPFTGGLITNAYMLFVNKDKDISCRWGTPRAICFDSEKYQTTLHLQARGSFTLVVDDGVKLYSRMLGQLDSYNAEDVDDFIFDKVIQIITDRLANAVQQQNILFSQIQSHTVELSKTISNMLRSEEIFETYGLKLRGDLSIASLTLPDEDVAIVKETDAQFRQMQLDMLRTSKQGQGEANAIYAKGMAEAEVMKSKGAYYAMERSYDVLQAAAQNEGGGAVGGGGTNLMTAGIGLGMGAGLAQGFGNAMGNMVGNAFQPQMQNPYAQNPGMQNPYAQTPGMQNPYAQNPAMQPGAPSAGVVCQKCQFQNPAGAKFCNGCGEMLAAPAACFCTQCGTSNSPDAKFCNACGFKMKD